MGVGIEADAATQPLASLIARVEIVLSRTHRTRWPIGEQFCALWAVANLKGGK